MTLENVDKIGSTEVTSECVEAINNFDANDTPDVTLLTILWFSFNFVF